jgi:hypothetical protein
VDGDPAVPVFTIYLQVVFFHARIIGIMKNPSRRRGFHFVETKGVYVARQTSDLGSTFSKSDYKSDNINSLVQPVGMFVRMLFDTRK